MWAVLSMTTLGSWPLLLPVSVPVPLNSIVPAPWKEGLLAVRLPDTTMVPLSSEL
jgi:hypothetical protein